MQGRGMDLLFFRKKEKYRLIIYNYNSFICCEISLQLKILNISLLKNDQYKKK